MNLGIVLAEKANEGQHGVVRFSTFPKSEASKSAKAEAERIN
tara:strand:+ start:1073 stop:1198 length:126 start_codon:yes stop_codon:yes gene_type:complete